jgi:alpha-tubulin suppressor-like RCC1 family protein
VFFSFVAFLLFFWSQREVAPDFAQFGGGEPSPRTDRTAPDVSLQAVSPLTGGTAAPVAVFTEFPDGPASGTRRTPGSLAASLREYMPAPMQTDWRKVEPWASRAGTIWTLVEIFPQPNAHPARLESFWHVETGEEDKPWPERRGRLVSQAVMTADALSLFPAPGAAAPAWPIRVAWEPRDEVSGVVAGTIQRWEDPAEMDRLLEDLRALPGIEWAEPVFHSFPCAVPNDTRYGEQWYTRTFSATNAGINLEWLWDKITDASTMRVAVVDTFFDTTHPEFTGNLLAGYCYTRGSADVGIPADRRAADAHGTHVAGIVAARGNNSRGVTGAAWRANVLPLATGTPSVCKRQNGSTENCYQLDGAAIASSFDWARSQGARVINCSYGSYSWSRAQFNAAARAAAADILIVCAAGNETTNTDQSPHYPSCFALDAILSIGASSSTHRRAGFSNFGASSVDVFAPGQSILNLVPVADGSYEYYNGTSMASPLTAGVAAVLRARYSSLSALDIKTALIRSARKGNDFTGQCLAGGTIDARRASEYIESIFALSQGVRFARGDVTLRIDDSGQVYAWGNGKGGLLGDGTSRFSMSPAPVPGMTGAVTVAALKDKVRVLRDDGTVWWWGRGADSTVMQTTPAQMPGLADIVDISADARDIFYYLRRDGLWRSEEYLKHGSFDTLSTGIAQISEAFAFRANGTSIYRKVVLPAVEAWTLDGPTLPAGFRRVSADLTISATLVLDSAGAVWCHSDNLHAQRGDGTVAASSDSGTISFVKVPGLSGITAVSSCGFSCAALSADGMVFQWGLRPGASAGDNNVVPRPLAIALPPGERAVGICMARNRKGSGVDGVARNRARTSVPFMVTEYADEVGMLFIECSSGRVYALGQNTFGALGTGSGLYAFPEPVAQAVPLSERAFASTESSTVWLDSAGLRVSGYDGTKLEWPSAGGAEVMFNFQRTGKRILLPTEATAVTDVACGAGVFFTWRQGGDVYAWGRNTRGLLGSNLPSNQEFSAAPVSVPGLNGIKSIAVGADHALALTTGGAVYAWGSNGSGQLGQGTKDSLEHSVPALVAGTGTVTAIAATENASFALTGDGRLLSWGRGASALDFALGLGKLLPESVANSTTPSAVNADGTPVTGVSAFWVGYGRLYWRRTDGTVIVLGNNEFNATGLGSGIAATVTSATGALPSLQGALRLALCRGAGMAQMADGRILSWGTNRLGLLGKSLTDLTAVRAVPEEIPSLRNVNSWIKSGRNSLFALRNSGSMTAWGNAWVGTIPNGTAWLTTPAPVLGFGGVSASVASASAVASTPSWLQERFTESEIATGDLTADNADADGDGWCNLLEYAFGTDPRSCQDMPRIEVSVEAQSLAVSVESGESVSTPERYLTLTAHRTGLRSDIRWQVESSDDLLHWTADDPNMTVVSDSWTRLIVSDTQPAGQSPRRWLRFRVSRLTAE